MIEGFKFARRNLGHWDVVSAEGRLFRLRGGPGQWDLIDERIGKGQNSTMMAFKEQSAAATYICAELMHELLTVEGQTPAVMESWNIKWTNDHDRMGPKYKARE